MSKKKIRTPLIIANMLIVFLLILPTIQCAPKLNESLLMHTSANKFSDDAYTIFFAKVVRIPNNHGGVFKIYSVKSDGSSLAFKGYESSMAWGERSHQYGIGESMGKYYGDFLSPDGKKNLIVETGWLTRWSFFFLTVKLVIEQNGQKDFLTKGTFHALEWLPDSRRIVFYNGDQIGIIDIESKKIAYLADGAGWIWVEETKR